MQHCVVLVIGGRFSVALDPLIENASEVIKMKNASRRQRALSEARVVT
ncbi:hypothetical protein JOC94_001956 [Bacillus thermophilus]|uniref:Uncharacterized protein n=1 Tax=Siminovitchia thermophila TaxID=1245522 RepID=A0ABS2R766_9BACI|nr:hypothetical protein [Siminovitchia thermophila]MBM7714984.1 hypothetical protein [Siminovitchia thermophila]